MSLATADHRPAVDDFAAARRAMVASQLRTSGINTPALLDAFGMVAREDYVGAQRRAVAYVDRSIPLSPTRAMNPAATTAALIDALALDDGDTVLVVGAATGYAVAIVARLARMVVGVECDAALANAAKIALPHATLVVGALEAGAAAHAPYDAILIDGAVETVPPALIAQLSAKGRLATGLVDAGVTRLALGRRGGHGFGLIPFADAEAVILPGFAKPRPFAF